VGTTTPFDRPGIAIAPDGTPYVGYQTETEVRVAHLEGSSWVSELVMNRPAGSGFPGVSHLSMAVNPATLQPAVAVTFDSFLDSSVKFAERSPGGTWGPAEIVDDGFGTSRGPNLAYDPATGQPTVSYGKFVDGLKFARRSSDGEWSAVIAAPETFPFPNATVLQYSPLTGHPGIAFAGADVIQFVEWDGSDWQLEVTALTQHPISQRFGFEYASDGSPVFAVSNGGLGESSIRIVTRNQQGWSEWSEFDTGFPAEAVDLTFSDDVPIVSFTALGHRVATASEPIVSSPSPPGDLNSDGVVDTADYVTWRNGLGTIFTPADYSVWRAHFGPIAATGSRIAATIPEPPTLMLFLLGAQAILSFRRVARSDVRANDPSGTADTAASSKYTVARPSPGGSPVMWSV
jgi:hypothetical protein